MLIIVLFIMKIDSVPWLVSSCSVKASCIHRLKFPRWLHIECVMLVNCAMLGLWVHDYQISPGPLWVWIASPKRQIAQRVIKGQKEGCCGCFCLHCFWLTALLLAAFLSSIPLNCFSSTMVLCHVTLPWRQSTMDWNLSSSFNFGRWVYCLSNAKKQLKYCVYI